jgi:hypothetical protein
MDKLARLRKMKKNVSITEQPSLGQAAHDLRATLQLSFSKTRHQLMYIPSRPVFLATLGNFWVCQTFAV